MDEGGGQNNNTVCDADDDSVVRERRLSERPNMNRITLCNICVANCLGLHERTAQLLRVEAAAEEAADEEEAAAAAGL